MLTTRMLWPKPQRPPRGMQAKVFWPCSMVPRRGENENMLFTLRCCIGVSALAQIVDGRGPGEMTSPELRGALAAAGLATSAATPRKTMEIQLETLMNLLPDALSPKVCALCVVITLPDAPHFVFYAAIVCGIC